MDTSIRRPFHIVGLIFASLLTGMVLYVSLDVVSRRSGLCTIFCLGLGTEVIATLIFLPLFILEDVIKAKKLTLNKFVHRRISVGLHMSSAILAILGALVPLIWGEIFLVSMMLTIHAATLLALACAYALISDRILRSASKGSHIS